ncbi:MAG: nucleotidyltransferase [Rhodoferax sp.]|nr:nucleotidyltransferase [Rhodoferax sp.]
MTPTVNREPEDEVPCASLTLLVLAAGMGSRFGGLKQLEPVGPAGETVMDYAVFDALRAGFTRVVFVIREDFAPVFRQQIGSRYQGRISVAYALQDLHDLPPGISPPPGRTRPWGTAHAVLAARHLLDGPFAVVNADDFYGRDAYRKVGAYLRQMVVTGTGPMPLCMAGYRIASTLSAYGGVNRGICHTEAGWLVSVEEHTGIALDAEGRCLGQRPDGRTVLIAPHALASMNFWGFTPAILPQMMAQFARFFADGGERIVSAEWYIPTVVDRLIQDGAAACRVLEADGSWFGVTYPQDKPVCVDAIRRLIQAGVYPDRLWS